MNSKSYESFFSIWILFFFFAFLFFLLFFFSFGVRNIRKYQMFNGLVSSENQVMLLVSDSKVDWFYRNQVVLIDGKKVRFLIDRKVSGMKKKKGQDIYQIYLSVDTTDYAVNSSITVGLLQEKVSFLSVFFHLWEGG